MRLITPATWHRWICPTITTARQVGIWLIYPGRWRAELISVAGYVLRRFTCHSPSSNHLIATQLGVEPTMLWLQVQCCNHYITSCCSVSSSSSSSSSSVYSSSSSTCVVVTCYYVLSCWEQPSVCGWLIVAQDVVVTVVVVCALILSETLSLYKSFTYLLMCSSSTCVVVTCCYVESCS